MRNRLSSRAAVAAFAAFLSHVSGTTRAGLTAAALHKPSHSMGSSEQWLDPPLVNSLGTAGGILLPGDTPGKLDRSRPFILAKLGSDDTY
jgi:hypothetical protein